MSQEIEGCVLTKLAQMSYYAIGGFPGWVMATSADVAVSNQDVKGASPSLSVNSHRYCTRFQIS